MTQTISRLYASKSDADAAIADLTGRGFTPGEIFVVGPPDASMAAADEASAEEGSGKGRSRKSAKGARPSGARTVADEIAEAIASGRILKRHADTYAKRVAEGAVLVTVYAPFGTGFKAASILDRHSPAESGVTHAAKPAVRYDERTPLSSGLRMSTRMDDPTPFGTFWNVPTLWASAAPLSGLLKYSTAYNSASPLSTMFGWPVLTDKGATVSSLFGLPLLI